MVVVPRHLVQCGHAFQWFYLGYLGLESMHAFSSKIGRVYAKCALTRQCQFHQKKTKYRRGFHQVGLEMDSHMWKVESRWELDNKSTKTSKDYKDISLPKMVTWTLLVQVLSPHLSISGLCVATPWPHADGLLLQGVKKYFVQSLLGDQIMHLAGKSSPYGPLF